MSNKDFKRIIDRLVTEDDRYSKDSYIFIRQALDHTFKVYAKEKQASGDRHVSGSELLVGIRNFALDQYGPMAKAVLGSWGIHQSEDFGNIVFNLVKCGVLKKTDDDKLEDFRDGFDFEQVFVDPFLPKAKKGVS